MNVCQNCFDSTSRGPVYELLAINCSISPKLDSYLSVYIDNLKCVFFVR